MGATLEGVLMKGEKSACVHFSVPGGHRLKMERMGMGAGGTMLVLTREGDKTEPGKGSKSKAEREGNKREAKSKGNKSEGNKREGN